MQNSVVMFNFFVFDRKYLFWTNLVLSWNLVAGLIQMSRIQWCCSIKLMPFLGKFGPNCQYCQFKMKLDYYTNANMRNSMAVLTFFVFDPKCPFCANLVHNVKIVSLRLNLVASLVRICRIHWCCSLFSFSTGNAALGQIWFKKSKLSI